MRSIKYTLSALAICLSTLIFPITAHAKIDLGTYNNGQETGQSEIIGNGIEIFGDDWTKDTKFNGSYRHFIGTNKESLHVYLDENDKIESYTIESIHELTDESTEANALVFKVGTLVIGSSIEDIKAYTDNLSSSYKKTEYTNAVSCKLTNGYEVTFYFFEKNIYGELDGLYKIQVYKSE